MFANETVRSLKYVLLCHDDPVLRLGLEAALTEHHFSQSFHACCPDDRKFAELLDFANVVVTGYDHGLELAKRLRPRYGQRPPATQVVIVSRRDGEHDIRAALDAGVKGYLLTDCEIEEMVLAIRNVCLGSRHLCSAAANRMLDSLTRQALTAREMQVLRCLVDGYVNKRICDELDIAIGTVKAHVKSIFEKLGVVTRTQAVAVATTRGIVVPVKAGSARPATGTRSGAAPTRAAARF